MKAMMHRAMATDGGVLEFRAKKIAPTSWINIALILTKVIRTILEKDTTNEYREANYSQRDLNSSHSYTTFPASAETIEMRIYNALQLAFSIRKKATGHLWSLKASFCFTRVNNVPDKLDGGVEVKKVRYFGSISYLAEVRTLVPSH
jgi:hypothetical protein